MINDKKTVALVILDGWGQPTMSDSDAIHAAATPCWDQLLKNHPHTSIATSGLSVGLPDGQMGNSEVGHMNIGAGRTVYQNLTRISKAINDGDFYQNPVLTQSLEQAIEHDKAVHILGLVSPGGVHSHIEHIEAACELAVRKGAKKVYVHAFLDGRDTPPRSAIEPLKALEEKLKNLKCGRIASMIGRFYAMDRDQHWERTEKAYRMIVEGQGEFLATNVQSGLESAYQRGENDEFVQATLIGTASEQPSKMELGDAVIFMNFRPDRARQLSRAFADMNFEEFERPLTLARGEFVTLTQYADDIDAPCAYPPQRVANGLGEYLAQAGKKQLRVAETEKYAHVTFFFNGGREKPFNGESRQLIPSPRIASYDLQPEMSAQQVTEHFVNAIHSQEYDLIVCNYANGDMVGHTGNFDAALKAVETLDQCLEKVVSAIHETGSECLITADHGNVEQMSDPNTGQAHTAHTSGPVPLVYVSNAPQGDHLCDGSLADIAPTLLHLMGMDKPEEMTGNSLLNESPSS